MTDLENVEVRQLVASELDRAALLAAGAMRDNPLQVTAIGGTPERRETVMYRGFARLLLMDGRSAIGAWDGERLVGVAASADPGHCQPSWRAGLRLAPSFLMVGRAAPRLIRWVTAWARQDPQREHSHLGPVGVDRGLQGRGIGSRLLADYCSRMDQAGMLSYLETDKPENVRLYRRFGYEVIAEAPVLGITSWFMTREPTSRPGS